ncbi:MAG TPA: hypothetical protein VMG40_05790 [Bryobacteraceae bacterium]|nr:hypothetical protein [Bryobacteraceae bacterium]
MRKLRFSAVLVLSALSSSCWLQKKTVVFVPPPPQVQPQVPTQVAALPQPPAIEGDPTATQPPVVADSFPEIAPPAPRPVTHHSAPPPVRSSAPTAPAPEQVQPPTLGPMFTADQRREYNRALDESLDHVRRALEVLASRNLNPEQAQVRSTISTFQKQAEQYRDQDLISAVNLAHRADLLAQDLLQRVTQ